MRFVAAFLALICSTLVRAEDAAAPWNSKEPVPFKSDGRRVNLDPPIERRICQTTRTAITGSDVDRLESLSKKLLLEKSVSPNGNREIFFMVNCLDTFANDQESSQKGGQKTDYSVAMKTIELWRKKYTESATATVALAYLHDSHAWTIRGTKWASEVPEDSMRLFEQEEASAKSLLDEAKPLSLDNPTWYGTAMSVYRAVGASSEEYLKMVDEAMDRFPDIAFFAGEGAVSMTPRWGGSDHDVRAYIDRMVARTPAEYRDIDYGEIIGTLLFRKMYKQEELQPALGADFDRVEKGYRDRYKRFPQPFNLDLEASVLCHLYDIPNTALLLKEIGSSPIPEAWSESRDARFYLWCKANVDAYQRTKAQ